MEQDDELIAHIKNGESVDQQRKKASRPSSRGWDYTRSDLADIKDMLMVVAKMVAHSDEPIQSVPRPETAHERWERNKRHENTSWLMGQIGLNHD